jgi:hypothetical protein
MPETDAKKEEPPLGSVTDTVELYAKIDQDGNQSWTSTIPEDVEEAAENEETKKFAVIVRKSMFFLCNTHFVPLFRPPD